jgi:hypothetical protein
LVGYYSFSKYLIQMVNKWYWSYMICNFYQNLHMA